MKALASILAVLTISAPLTAADLIPANERIDWAGQVGAVNVVPTRTTIYTTLTSTATASDINTAIANCPAGQVVLLAAGTYNLSDPINFSSKNNVTLRGAGIGQTILHFTNNGMAGILIGQDENIGQVYSFDTLTANVAPGATSFTVADDTDYVVGKLVFIDQTDDTDLIHTRASGGSTWTNTSSSRSMGHMYEITAKSSGTISIGRGTVWPYSTARSARSSPFLLTIKGSGVESLSITYGSTANTSPAFGIFVEQAIDCFIYDVESVRPESKHFWFTKTVGSIVQHCSLRGSINAAPNAAVGVELGSHNSHFLVADNIFQDLFPGVMVTNSSGGVVAYNYFHNVGTIQFQGAAIIGNHGPHPVMNLYEGNYANRFHDDGYHGTGSHSTLFRNRFHGTDPIVGTAQGIPVDLGVGARKYHVIGNVLGHDNMIGYELSGEPSYDTARYVYRLGYPGIGNNSTGSGGVPGSVDSDVSSTLLRSDNYDTYNASIQNVSGETLPNSFFLASKPAWFGSLPWPAYSPSIPSRGKGVIPAGYRYLASFYTLIAQDDFSSYTDEDLLSTAANWRLTKNNFSVESGALAGHQSGAWAAGYYHGAAFSPNQRVEGVILGAEATEKIGVGVRIQTGSDSWYAVVVDGSEIRLSKMVFGTESAVATASRANIVAIALEVKGTGSATRLNVQVDLGEGWVDKWADVDPGYYIDGGKPGVVGYGAADNTRVDFVRLLNLTEPVYGLIAQEDLSAYSHGVAFSDVATNWTLKRNNFVNHYGAAIGSIDSDWSVAYYSAATFNAHQRAEGTVVEASISGYQIGVSVRVQSSTDSWYALVIDSAQLRLSKMIAGTESTVLTDSSPSGIRRIALQAYGTGTGTRLKVQVDTGSGWVNKWVNVDPGSYLDGGKPGLAAYQTAIQARIDDLKFYSLPDPLIASDDFETYSNFGAFSDIAPNWTLRKGNFVTYHNSGNVSAFGAGSGWNASYYSAASFTSDQRAEVKILATLYGGYSVGAGVRIQAAADSWYAVVVDGTDIRLSRMIGGTETALQTDSRTGVLKVAIEATGAGSATRIKVQVDTGSGWTDKWTNIDPGSYIDGGKPGVISLNSDVSSLFDEVKLYIVP